MNVFTNVFTLELKTLQIVQLHNPLNLRMTVTQLDDTHLQVQMHYRDLNEIAEKIIHYNSSSVGNPTVGVIYGIWVDCMDYVRKIIPSRDKRETAKHILVRLCKQFGTQWIRKIGCSLWSRAVLLDHLWECHALLDVGMKEIDLNVEKNPLVQLAERIDVHYDFENAMDLMARLVQRDDVDVQPIVDYVCQNFERLLSGESVERSQTSYLAGHKNFECTCAVWTLLVNHMSLDGSKVKLTHVNRFLFGPASISDWFNWWSFSSNPIFSDKFNALREMYHKRVCVVQEYQLLCRPTTCAILTDCYGFVMPVAHLVADYLIKASC